MIINRLNLAVISVFVLSSVLIQGCKKDKDNNPVVQYGSVLFVFENYVDSVPVEMDAFNYTNDAGNVYSIDLLKYYISNMVFTKNDNSKFFAENYELINEDVPSSKSFLVALPYGDYNELKFYVGVDSVKNISGAQSGTLDPVYGMFWDWNSGYIYFKHEGKFIETNNDTLPIVYHFGALEALTTHQFTVNLNVSETAKVIKVRFNLNKLYNAPNQVNFHNNNIHSGGANFVNTLKENFDSAFTLTVM